MLENGRYLHAGLRDLGYRVVEPTSLPDGAEMITPIVPIWRSVRAAKSTADYGRGIAERAALVSVGATLEARDRAVALVNDIRDLATKPEVSISKS